MEYNKAGGITVKDGTGSNFMNAVELNYNLQYGYNGAKPHQLEMVDDIDNGIPTHFEYNTSGSIKVIDDPVKGQPQIFFWNEEQQLTGVSNEQGIHQYIYDYKGERIMKSSVLANQVYVNDQTIDEVYNLEPYTVYVNPYYVITGLINGDKVSKHYYMNTQRVATDITINYDPNQPMQGSFKTGNTQENDYISESIVLQELNVILTDLDKKVLDQNDNLALPTIESYYPDLSTSTTSSKTGSAEAIGGSQRIIFWYHPDYLGNVDLVTDIDGNAYEFFMYNPWGEQMHHWNANTYSFSSPFRFNGKELDPETGLAYYGARYYQNKLSVWLSVDAFAEKYNDITPYSFSANNPNYFIDPQGDSIITTQEAWGAIKLGLTGVLGTNDNNSPFLRGDDGKLIINDQFDKNNLKSNEQKELYNHYSSLIKDEKHNVFVQVIGNNEEILKNNGETTTLVKWEAQGLTVWDGKDSKVYISKEPLYKKDGDLTKQPQRENEIGITAIHEIAGHAYYYSKNIHGDLNNSRTEDFDNSMRKVYKGLYMKNYFKHRPCPPHKNE